MAEIINSNVFDPSTKKFVDFAGLDYFWEKAKAYVDAADKVIADKVAALETTVGDADKGLVKEVAALRTEVNALGGAEGGISGMIDSAIAALDVEDTAEDGKYVSAVSEEDGKIKVTRADLPDYSNTYADKAATEAHIADANIHVKLEDKNAWNKAVADLDAFLKGEAIEGSTVDTLKEIQDYITSDGSAAAELVNRVGTLESAVTVINGTEEGSIAKAKADALAAVSTLENGPVKTNTDAIAVINGDGEGSIAKAKADALAAVSTLENGLVKTNTDAIAVINGDGKGSIAKAEANAKAYTDALYTSITFASTTDIDGLFNVSAE